MCGIFATLRRDGRDITAEELERGTSALEHRGPDGIGTFREGPVGLGMQRLAIVDVEGGDQPFISDDGQVALVGNGELYESVAMRAWLERRGARFRSHSDIEVALHLYLYDGIEAVARLRGMFGLAIWDGRRRELLAVRDRFGIKPILWHDDGKALHLGSENVAIRAVTGPLEFDRAALGQVLTFGYVPGSATGFEGLHELPPGHVLRAGLDGSVRIDQLVETAFDPDELADAPTLIRETRQALDSSVSHHLLSDVPVGSFLSSGIDSTALVALARKHDNLVTFSVGVEGAVDEAALAAESARALGVEHRFRQLGPSDIFDVLPDAIRHLGPLADPSAVALYHLSALAAEHVKVVLSGEGADELFGGYRIYRQPGTSRPVEVLPAGVRRRIHAAALQQPRERRGRGYALRASSGVEAWYRGNVTITSDELRAALLPDAGWKAPRPRDTLKASWDRSRHLDDVTRMQTVDLDAWLPGDILAKADRASMAHSLEVRVPFLDEEVWSVARRIPARLRLAKGTTKYVLRRSVADLIPEQVTNRRKLGFPVPVTGWLRGERGAGIESRLLEGPLGSMFDPAVVRRVVADHREGRAEHGRLVWTLLVLAVWAEEMTAQDRPSAVVSG